MVKKKSSWETPQILEEWPTQGSMSTVWADPTGFPGARPTAGRSEGMNEEAMEQQEAGRTSDQLHARTREEAQNKGERR